MSLKLTSPSSQPDSSLPSSNASSKFSCVTPHSLLSLFYSVPSLLILDCRSFVDFNLSHIRNSFNVTCPSLVLKRLKSAQKPDSLKLTLTQKLVSSPSAKEMCREGRVTAIVLYDSNTKDPESSPGLLADLLQLLQQDVPSLFYLQGGFSSFREMFPDHCSTQVQAVRRTYTSLPTAPVKLCKDVRPTQILPHLFLGSRSHAEDSAMLSSLGITYILNVAKECASRNGDPRYKCCPLMDTTDQDLESCLEDCFRFIEEARRNGERVLVHCVGGISRSVAVTLAYLMKTQQLTLDAAYSQLRQKKSDVAPNLNFMGQLLDFEKQHVFGGVVPQFTMDVM